MFIIQRYALFMPLIVIRFSFFRIIPDFNSTETSFGLILNQSTYVSVDIRDSLTISKRQLISSNHFALSFTSYF
jgi:hypothetical protein